MDTGSIALPERYRRGAATRVVEGADGRLYSIFGLGHSLSFACAIATDRLIAAASGRAFSPAERERPGFVATTWNAGPTALAGALVLALALEVGVSVSAAVFAALAFVFGSQALHYSRASFDMPLGIAMLFAMVFFLVRGQQGPRSKRPLSWAFAGAALGFATLTRLPSAIFVLPAALYVWRCRGERGPRDGWLRDTILFATGALPFVIAMLAFNTHRFGSPFDTGYTGSVRTFAFDAPLWHTLPALVVSPGRGFLFFSPLLLLALPGLGPFWKRARGPALLVLSMAVLNLLFYAANRNWSTWNGWGPRFQLGTVLLLSVPVAFGVDRLRRRALGWSVLAAVVAAQIALVGVDHRRPADDSVWSLAGSQIADSASRLSEVLAEGRPEDLDFWWAKADPGVATLVFWLAMTLASGIVLALSARASERTLEAAKERDVAAAPGEP